jgi:DNA polymerase I
MTKDNKTTVLVIDGYHLLHKGFYGSLKRKKVAVNRDGLPINAIYTFIAKINQLIDLNCYYTIIVTFDVGDGCWRRDLYPEYKAKRKETPEELIPQMQIIREFLTAANISWYEKEKFEGDDVMGTIVRIATKIGYRVHILSNDKDTFQLVNENVKVITNTSKKEKPEFIETNDVIEKMGCLPKQVPDLKSLMGDASDNIKGLKGLHYHTVTKLLATYPHVEDIYQNLDELTPSLRQKLSANESQVMLNKKIATIQKDLNLGRINFHSLKINWYGYLNFLKKQKMWNFTPNVTKHIQEIQRLKMSGAFNPKNTTTILKDADLVWKRKAQKK